MEDYYKKPVFYFQLPCSKFAQILKVAIFSKTVDHILFTRKLAYNPTLISMDWHEIMSDQYSDGDLLSYRRPADILIFCHNKQSFPCKHYHFDKE